jgi:hypothetical protein
MLAIYNLTQNGSLAVHLRAVKEKVAQYYRCSNSKECELSELIALQWGSSGITNNVSGIYKDYPDLKDVLTLQEWLPTSDLSTEESKPCRAPGVLCLRSTALC